MCALRAFDGDDQLKQDLLAQVQASEDAKNIVHGVYGEYETRTTYDDYGYELESKIVGPWRGCAVGVIVHGGHYAYGGENFHGIPRRILTALEDIYERQGSSYIDNTDPDAATYPRRLLEAIPVGADLSTFQFPQTWCESCEEYHDQIFESFDEFLDAVRAAAQVSAAQ